MFRQIVAAIDGSEASLRALDCAINLAARVGAALDVVSVEEELPHYVSEQAEESNDQSEAERFFGSLHVDAAIRAAQHGVSLTTKIIVGHEVQSLLNYVRDRHADLLVVGAIGHSGVWDTFLGSTADKLVAHAPTSVLVVHPSDAGHALKEIVVGVDGSPNGERALSTALELGHWFGGTVRGLSVAEGTAASGATSVSAWIEYLQSVQAKARSAAAAAEVRLEVTIRQGHAAKALITYADEVDADLIVIGATGHERPWSVTTGGTARRVANENRGMVLIVRPPLPISQVRDVMSRHVTTVTPDVPLQIVVSLLVRRGVKALPVVDARERVVGIITGGDLLRRGKLGARLSLQGVLDPAEMAGQIARSKNAGGVARNVMTPNPWTITADARLDTAIHALVRHRIKRLPVVEEERRLVGIVSRTDILRAVAVDRPIATPDLPRTTVAHTVADLMTANVPTVAPTASADDVLTAIVDSPFRRVVVTDADRRVVGIVTDRSVLAHADPSGRASLFEQLAGRATLGSTARHGPSTAASLMEREVFTIHADATVADAVQQFLAHRVKRLIVVDNDGKLLGIIDRRAVLCSLVPSSSDAPPNGGD